MKIEKREITEIQNFYIADDGTEFVNKSDCERYEKENENRIKRKHALDKLGEIKSCPFKNYAPFGYDYTNTEEIEYYWYLPKDMSELNAINTAYNLKFESNCVGKWICIENVSGDYWEVFSGWFEKSIDKLKEFYKSIGYRVEIVKED